MGTGAALGQGDGLWGQLGIGLEDQKGRGRVGWRWGQCLDLWAVGSLGWSMGGRP